jgi:hypothetical protein
VKREACREFALQFTDEILSVLVPLQSQALRFPKNMTPDSCPNCCAAESDCSVPIAGVRTCSSVRAHGSWLPHPVARHNNSCGMLNPIALAVLRFTVSSRRVGSWIGRSPGLAPFKILMTESTAVRASSSYTAA